MALYRITAPAEMVVSVVDMKQHLRVDFTDDDDLIEAMIQAVIGHIDGGDGWLGRALIDQTWEWRLDNWPWVRWMEVPLPPLISVTSIKYYDTDNVLQTVDAADYRVVGAGGNRKSRIELTSDASWPTVYSRAESVIVRFRCGYVSDVADSPLVDAVPAAIAAAIKLLVGTLYANRETVVIGQTAMDLPWAAESLLAPFRIYSH